MRTKRAKHRNRARAKQQKAIAEPNPISVVADLDGPTPEMSRRICPDQSGNGIIRFSRDSIARLNLDSSQLRAAAAVQRAYLMITAPVGVRISNPGRTPGGGFSPSHLNTTEQDVTTLENYNHWCAEMNRQNLPLGPVLDVVIDGLACRAVDRARKKRDGTAAKLVRDGLDLYVKLAHRR